MLASSPAALAAPTDAVRLSYRAPLGCPSAAELEREVRRSLPSLRVAAAAEEARSFELEIAEDGLHGRLFLQDSGVRAVREVEAASCEEVARLLAFSVALAVDPDAKVPDGGATGRAAFDEPPAPAASVAPSPGPAPKTPRAQPPLPAAPSKPNGSKTTWGVGVYGFAASALAPHVTFGGAAAADATWRSNGWRPRVRFGGSYSTSAPALVEGASVRFRSWLALVEFCPQVWQSRQAALSLCARADAGIRTAAGSDIPGARTVPRPWLSLGPAVQGRWKLAPPIFVELGGSLLFPVLQDRVYLRPDTTVHDVPIAGFVGEFGIGVEFGDQTEN